MPHWMQNGIFRNHFSLQGDSSPTSEKSTEAFSTLSQQHVCPVSLLSLDAFELEKRVFWVGEHGNIEGQAISDASHGVDDHITQSTEQKL